MNTLLAIDLGTSSLKVALIDKHHTLVAFKRWVYPSPSSYADPLSLLAAFIGEQPIGAIALSVQGPTLVGIDANATISVLLPYNDGLVMPLANTPSVFLPKINYLKQQRPDLYNKTNYFFNVADYLVFLLTGAIQTSHCSNNTAYQPFLWNQQQVQAYHIDNAKLPPFTAAGAVLGYTNGRFGLAKGIPIKLTTFDFMAGLIGVGKSDPQVAINRTGTSEGFNFYTTNKPTTLPYSAAPWRTTPHPSGQGFNVGLVDNNGSLFYHSLKEKAGYNDIDSFLTDVVTKNSLPLQTFRATIEERLLSFKKIINAWPNPINKVVVTGGFGYSKALNGLKASIWGIEVTSFDNPYTELVGLKLMVEGEEK